jgi:DNA-binding NarL/FixJ family response regulator
VSHFKVKEYSVRKATIFRLHAAGKSTRDIAEVVGMSPGRVSHIITEARRVTDALDLESNGAVVEDFGAAE